MILYLHDPLLQFLRVVPAYHDLFAFFVEIFTLQRLGIYMLLTLEAPTPQNGQTFKPDNFVGLALKGLRKNFVFKFS